MSHVRKPLAFAAIFNAAIVAGEGIAGIKSQSLSLIMDGIHNLSDEMALLFLFLAYILPLSLSKNLQRSANFLNSLGLVVISAILIVQAIVRFQNPVHVIGVVPVIVGLLAAGANGAVAAFLWKVKAQNAAIRLAYLHNLGDVYVSFAPVASGIIVLLTGKYIFDPLIAVAIGVWFIWSTVQEVLTSREQLLWPEDAVCKHESPELLQQD